LSDVVEGGIIAMKMVTLAAGHGTTAYTDLLKARASQAGAQFEGILLNMVFGELQRTFSQLPGSTRDAVSKSYDGFGTEALTSGLARSGGIGLGAFITKALMKQATHASDRI
jgi:Rod binding domain-containing protein